MKFKYTILYVADVAKTLEFYHQAFGFEIAMLHDAGDYGELMTGDTRLSFSSLNLMKQLGKDVASAADQAAVFEIAFETENVDESLQQALSAGAELVQGVEQMPWGQTTAYVRDINGFLIEICSPVAS